jgi:excisionase family DNA binding protein
MARTQNSGRGETGTPATFSDSEASSATHSRRAFSISQFCLRYGIGRTNAYQEIAAGRLRAVKVGRRTLITRDAAETWLAELPAFTQSNRSLAVRRGNKS